MSAKHTLGPWSQDEWGTVRDAAGERVTVEGLSLSCASNEETRANARLIAAAPELLEALRGALVDDLLPYHSPEWIAKARAAIAKATGEKA